MKVEMKLTEKEKQLLIAAIQIWQGDLLLILANKEVQGEERRDAATTFNELTDIKNKINKFDRIAYIRELK